MRSVACFLTLPLLLALSLAGSAAGEELDGRGNRTGRGIGLRWIPESCALVLGIDGNPSAFAQSEDSDEALWNQFYRAGIRALGRKDLRRAEESFCKALEAARSFGARDIRFAETLDELGLVSYLAVDFETAEEMQGAAVAELLLTLGPPPADLVEAADASCSSSVATYLVRLGWIFDRQGRGPEIDQLLHEPYRILERAYVPYGSLPNRLDWLVSQYLLVEDFAAADWIDSLRESLRDSPNSLR